MRLGVFDAYRVGVVDGEEIADISSLIPRWAEGDVYAMTRLIGDWDTLRGSVERGLKSAPRKRLSSVKLRAPQPAPMQLLAAPSNYRAHVKEMRERKDTGPESRGGKTANELGFFMKANGSISGQQDPITLPLKTLPGRLFEHEGEIAFVIGKRAQGVKPEDAVKHIFGYTIMVDATLRGTPEVSEERVQRKSFASFSPMGPFITTADEMGDWRDISVQLWLNGEQRQDAKAIDMIVDIPNLLSRASYVMPLFSGDVYTTGSPPFSK
jgi:2-keto-4-pentenoate hydratase/2-oxohepta-3-ene-1,7-dioic acid hydratase in catechol pathway